MSLIESVGFGKFHKGKLKISYFHILTPSTHIVHVCNLKEFKLFAGPNLNSLHPILHTGLNNDTISESFPPDYSLSGLPDKQPFPVQFIKIVPLAAWGSNFNFSIWYIELRGWEASGDPSSSQSVKATLDEYNKIKEEQTTRLILKFLRQQNHQEAFAALQNNSGIQLEAPVVTQLHNLMKQNCFKEAEQLLINLFNHDPKIFDQYLHDNVPYQVQWIKM
jgi:muskelin